MDALLNHAAKVETFSGGKWTAPLVVRAPCGGGYGDGGQHEQSLWGWLAHIPGLTVLVPSTPADAGGLMLAALEHGGPVLDLGPARKAVLEVRDNPDALAFRPRANGRPLGLGAEVLLLGRNAEIGHRHLAVSCFLGSLHNSNMRSAMQNGKHNPRVWC